ncbi:MAG: ABC transporter permease [Gemmatimonadaceae bacterium]
MSAHGEADAPAEPRWRRYLRFWRTDARGDIDDELRFHLDMRARDYRAAGHSPEDARRLAMERFGDARDVRAECEEMGARRLARQRRAETWDAARQDLRFGVRTLMRQPGFAAAVIITLALGLGANTAVFSVASGVLLDPLPFTDAERLVRLWSNKPERQLPRFSVSALDYLDWRRTARTVTAMAAFERQRDVSLERGGEPEQIEAARVSSALFPLLGGNAHLGRTLIADDERPGAPPVAVIGHEVWEARFGADSSLLVAQMLAESLLLSVAAGAVGVLLAAGGVRLLRAFGTESVPRIEQVALDGRVLGYTALLSLVATLIFGLLPALRGSRASLIDPLKRIGRGVSGEGVRATLVVAQVTLSLVLLVGTALLIQSFVRLQRVELGFDPRRLVVAPLGLPEAAYPEQRMAIPFYESLLERARGFPGVQAAGVVSSPPFGGPNTGLMFAPEGRPLAAREQAPDADYRVVSPGYLRAMGISLLRGRDFTASDDSTTPRVVLISETLARRVWPGEDPVGRRLRAGDVEGGPLATIVGVVGDVRYQSLETPELRPLMYFAQRQRPQRQMSLVARTPSQADALVLALRREVAALDRSLPAPSLFEMEERLDQELAGRRFALTLFAVFGAVALVLTAIGIYGVIAYGVRQRAHEIGVRVALGAPRRTVVSMVVGRALRLTAAGVVLGVGAGWLLTRTMSGLLFGVAPTHSPTFAAVAALLVIVAVAASALPARRATTVDAAAALRMQ